MGFRRQTSSTGPRRWRVPALLASSVLVGTAVTVGVAAPGAQADTSLNVLLGGNGAVVKDVCAAANTVYALPGSTIKFASDTTGLTLPNDSDLANLLGVSLAVVGGLLNTLNVNQVLTTVTQDNRPIAKTGTNQTASSSVTFDQQGTFRLQYSSVLPINGLLIHGEYSFFTNKPLTVVVSADARDCSLKVGVSAPVTVSGLPSINVNVPGVGGVQVGSSSSKAPPSSSPPPAAAATAAAAEAATGSSTPSVDYSAPDCTGPCAVVPRGGGGGGQVGAASGVTFGDLDDPAAGSPSGSGSAAAAGSGGDAALVAVNGADSTTQLAVDRAFGAGRVGSTEGPGVSTGLAVAATAALGGVTVLWIARRRLARS